MYESVGVGDVWSIKMDGSDPKQITRGIKARFVSVSPDGKKIAVSVVRERSDIESLQGQPIETSDMWLMDAETTGQTASSSHIDLSGDLKMSQVGGRDGATFADWSSQSDKLVFTYKPDSSASVGISTKELYIVNTDGKDRKKIATGVDYPSFLPNSESIAVAFGVHWDIMGLKIIDSSGTDQKEIEPIPTTIQVSIGKPFALWYQIDPQVLYVASVQEGGGATPGTTVYLADTKTGEKKALCFSPDVTDPFSIPSASVYTQRIVLQRGISGMQGSNNATIWTVKLDGSELKQLTDGPGDTEPILFEEKRKGGTTGTTNARNVFCHKLDIQK
jgi:Tol biopolymer transport system component